jgi:alpha-mannosidase
MAGAKPVTCDDEVMRIVQAQSTPLFVGTERGPCQVVRVTVAAGPPGRPASAPVNVRVEGPGVTTARPGRIGELPPGAELAVEVPVTVAAPHGPGSRLSVMAIAEDAGERAELGCEITAAEPGWTIWMVCHFHYDPVWWNTQGGFTEAGLAMPGEDGRLPDVRTAFELVRLHLDAARDDPDYKFVLAEVDYLKPYFDAHAGDRAELRELIAAGRAELVGGAYNEPNTNLTSAESTIRNIIYGLGHQRDVLGADPSVAWALDAFGHDPGYPGLMAAAGMTGSAWARGPFHQWGPWRTAGDNTRMQFPSEFEWISPDGRGLLTSYMANHYGAGWVIHQAASLEAAEQEALGQLALLAPVAATRNVLLPVGADHVIPPRWATAVHRDFAARYVWPRCVTGLPREFFAAVRAEAAERGSWLTPQTRDMNPVYPGKDVSYIDTKQAQRAAEVAVSDGERLATLAWLAGAGYPAESLDKAWRQLVFGAHHDAITGTESDQVYLDLLGGWREAFERGEGVREEAAGFLAGLVNTLLAPTPPPRPRLAPTPPPRPRLAPAPPPLPKQHYATTGAGVEPPARTVVVFNTLSWPRAGLAARTLEFAAPGPPWLALTDETGAGVPFLAEGIRRHPGHGLASVRITFLAEVPALGYRSYRVSAAPQPGSADEPGSGADAAAAATGWMPLLGTLIANDTFEVSADPARGGGLAQVLDQRTGTALLRGLGNELVLTEEYPAHPRWGEGPWLLCPRGPGTGSGGVPASVSAQRCPIGSRLVARFGLGDLRITQETILWDGLDRVEFRTHVDGSIGQDRLLRVRFPVNVPGGLPVFQCATAVIGRPFGVAGSDVAKDAYTLDNPACEWFGLSSAVRVSADGHTWAAGVAEVILPDAPAGTDRGVNVGLVSTEGHQSHSHSGSAPEGSRAGAEAEGSRASAKAEGSRAGAKAEGLRASAKAEGSRAGAKAEGSRASAEAEGSRASAKAEGSRASAKAEGLRAGVRGLVAALAAAGVTATCSRAGGPRYGALDLDSNLPDFRIAIGGPDVNPWTARLLAGLGLAGLGTVTRLAAPGGARVWVPAARLRAEVFTASADVRGDRDLPVLIVSGPDPAAAVADLTADLADAVIDADLAEDAPGDAGLEDRLLGTHSVALLNRGTPSSLVSPDGSLHIALMRASSAWPAQVWIDGPRRTPGDGSSFAWQHWSHEFRYALAAGTGDWRGAGFVVAGQEYNHDLLAVETGAHDGPLPLSASLAEVSTPGRTRPAALLSALKPRGNPLASGLPGRPRRDAGVTIRLRDADGRALVAVPPAGLTTLLAMAPPPHALLAPAPPPPLPTAAQAGPGGLGEPAMAGGTGREPAQPVFTRYWLHGKGPAPAGNLPVTVHLSPGHVTLADPAAARQPGPRPLYLSVACGHGSATGEVTLDVPPGLAVTGPDGGAAGPLRYALDASCPHWEWELSVAARPGAAPGRYFVSARTADDLGQALEDTALITVGEPPPPSRVMPRAERDALLVADLQAREAEVEVAVEPAVIEMPPGGRATLTVRLANRTASVIRGESQLMSPFGTWHQVGPWTSGFTAGPGETVTVDYAVAVPAWARPGSHWWALAKVMYFGRVRYTESAQIRVTG